MSPVAARRIFSGGDVKNESGHDLFPDISWWRAYGSNLSDGDWHDSQAQFLLWRLCPAIADAGAGAGADGKMGVCVAWKLAAEPRRFQLPPARPGFNWQLAFSSAFVSELSNAATNALRSDDARLPAHTAAVWREVATSVRS